MVKTDLFDILEMVYMYKDANQQQPQQLNQTNDTNLTINMPNGEAAPKQNTVNNNANSNNSNGNNIIQQLANDPRQLKSASQVDAYVSQLLNNQKSGGLYILTYILQFIAKQPFSLHAKIATGVAVAPVMVNKFFRRMFDVYQGNVTTVLGKMGLWALGYFMIVYTAKLVAIICRYILKSRNTPAIQKAIKAIDVMIQNTNNLNDKQLLITNKNALEYELQILNSKYGEHTYSN